MYHYTPRDEHRSMRRKKRLLFLGEFLAVLSWAIFVRSWGVSKRSFWMDEASIANIVLDFPWIKLLYQTEIPLAPLFAIVTKLTGNIVSPPEIGLRLLPMICGIACVPLTYFLMRTLRIPRITALVGMTLCASSPWLVIWSRELKQYEVEAFFSVLLALLVLQLRRCTMKRQQWMLIGGIQMVCLVGPWFGFGFCFPAITLSAVLMFLPPIFGHRKVVVSTGIVALCVVVGSITLLWNLSVADQASNQGLLDYMGHWFIRPTSFRSWVRGGVYGFTSTFMLLFPFFMNKGTKVFIAVFVGGAIWLFALLGLWTWPRKSRAEMVCWTIMPWLLLLAASVAQQYPFGAVRMTVFLAPSLGLAFAMGLVRFCRKLCRLVTGQTRYGVIFAMVIVLIPILYMLNIPIRNKYWANHDFRNILSVLKEKRNDSEVVVVTLNAVQPVRFYLRGEHEDFKYVPLTCGTRPMPGYNYVELADDILKDTGHQWWLLTTSFESDITRLIFMQQGRKQGYIFKLKAEAGGRIELGRAQLFAVVKRHLQ